MPGRSVTTRAFHSLRTDPSRFPTSAAPSRLKSSVGRVTTRREKPIPTGRLSRTAQICELVGGQAARGYATRVANLRRSEEDRQAAVERRPIEEAEKIDDVRGQLKV